MTKVLVLGSLNMDMVMTTEKIPQIGETILGETIDYFLGGKGANQAVAASRMNVPTKLLGKLGTDTFGDKILQHLRKEALDLSSIVRDKTVFTGVASIFKLAEDNAIVVLPGANSLLETSDLSDEDFCSGDVLLTQLEIPLETVYEGLKRAKDKNMRTILNPAPYHQNVPELLPFVDILTPNETEFANLIGKKKLSDAQLELEMLQWTEKHESKLIVTRGSLGVSYVEKNQIVTIAAQTAHVVDTTGAGDTFNGILAAKLATNCAFSEAVSWATIGATLAVEKLGAQTGMPTSTEIHQILKQNKKNT